MRARGGGVLSASALVAVGTSLLLAALVGVGLSALGTRDRGGATAGMRAEAAAVVVPGTDTKQTARHPRRHHVSHASLPQPVVLPGFSSAAATARPTARPTARTSPTSSTGAPTTRVTSATPTPTPSPTRAHGKGKGSGNGHPKPAKH